MKALLSRFALRRSIGLVIDDQRIAVSVVATTPLGRRQVFHDVQACDVELTPAVLERLRRAGCTPGATPGCELEPARAVLERLLQPWIKQTRGKKTGVGSWVQLGVPESQVFQAVVTITHANRTATSQAYFLEAVQATNIRAEDRIIDLLKLEINEQPLACVAASPRGAINSMIEMMQGLGTRVGMAEPAPASLYRAGAFYHKTPHNSKLNARFFLGRQQAIGVVAAGAQPLFWHTFDLPAGDETAAVLAANSTLWMLGRHSRITLPIDTVIVHGRPELALTRDLEAFRQRTGARLIRCAEPDYGPAAVALGAALADHLADEPGHDLARTLKPDVSLREIFPWGELVLHGALLGAVSLFLIGTAVEAKARLKAVSTELSSFSWLKQQDQAKLDAEKNTIQERLKIVDSFRRNRVGWSVVLRAVAAAAPNSTVITGLSGIAQVEATSKSATSQLKKQLIVQFATPMPEDGAMSREIDGFVTALRGEPALKRHFPLIEVTGYTTNAGQQGKHPFTSYSVVCLPKVDTIAKVKPH
jgi:hypothetical protein